MFKKRKVYKNRMLTRRMGVCESRGREIDV
jgi:hypothetical protein